MAPDKVKEVFTGAFTHGRESSNHLLVKYDELSSTWDNVARTVLVAIQRPRPPMCCRRLRPTSTRR